jgi:hypothetical protein
MDGSSPSRRAVVAGAVKVVALAIALAACFFVGTRYSRSALAHNSASIPDLSSGFPQCNASPLVDPRAPEPRAVEARARAIRRDAATIRGQLQAAGGDWSKWQRDTESYRAALQSQVHALKDSRLPGYTESLAGRDGFPLFEFRSRDLLRYLYDPSSLDHFRKQKAVVAAQRWLQERGIDLIYVPVPKMTEVYIERFLDPCPKDGVVAPHVRRELLELLENDVEVVDGCALFRGLRDTDREYLYNTADSHWAPRGMRIMAREIADRIARYNFGARARYGLPITKAVPEPFNLQNPDKLTYSTPTAQEGWQTLSADQQAVAKKYQTTNYSEVRMINGQVPADDAEAPVVLIGNSYVRHFREQLIKELNLLVNTRCGDNYTTQAFYDFLREPELLTHCRVVVWVIPESHMTVFHPVPKPLLMALNEGK